MEKSASELVHYPLVPFAQSVQLDSIDRLKKTAKDSFLSMHTVFHR